MSCIPIQDFSLISLCDATKAGKLYSIVPDSGAGDFDVTRASTATYVGSDGLLKTAATDEPRIEFNPDGSYKGLLVEPAATNLLLRSEEFDDAYWTKFNSSVTANTTTAPDGTLTADTITANVGVSFPSIRVNFSAAENTIFTLSSFVKAGTATSWRMTVVLKDGSSLADALFNSLTGQISGQMNLISSSMTPLQNDWFRCSITFNTGAGANDLNVRPVNHSFSTIGGNEFTDGRTVFLWGAQLETGSVATSYIPTVASTVTRAADVITRTGASGLIGQTEGTVYADFVPRVTTSIQTAFTLGSDNDNDYYTLNTIASTGLFRIRTRAAGGSVTTILGADFNTSEGRAKIALTYDSIGNLKFFVNGSKTVDESNISPLPNTPYDKISLGHTSGTQTLNGYIKAVALLPTAISEQAAINLTS